MMVADGEGATKVIRLRVRGAAGDEEARVVARAVADSSLVKTAMYGQDPNWGRILSSAGAVLPGRVLPNAMLILGGVQLVEEGTAVELTAEERVRLRAVMASPEVDILLDLGLGAGEDEVYFSRHGPRVRDHQRRLPHLRETLHHARGLQETGRDAAAGVALHPLLQRQDRRGEVWRGRHEYNDLQRGLRHRHRAPALRGHQPVIVHGGGNEVTLHGTARP